MNYKNILVNVTYIIKPGKREEFLTSVKEQGIIDASKAEDGNIKYEYYISTEHSDALFLQEIWTDANAQKAHSTTAHYKKLTELKIEYVTDVKIEKYEAKKF